MSKIIKNINELNIFTKNFLEKIKKENKNIIILNGDLGSGKTTFVQNIAKNLNIKENINSPTFTISKRYNISEQEKWKKLIHLDLYRLKKESDLKFIGLENDIQNKENLIFIEWPEIAKKILPKKILTVNIEYVENNYRKITIS